MFETDALRVLPEVLAMGPGIVVDKGLQLNVWRQPSEGDCIRVVVEVESDPSTRWKVLGGLSEEQVDAWTMRLLQRLNRYAAEGLEAMEVPWPTGAAG
jgi:hypothetical protein